MILQNRKFSTLILGLIFFLGSILAFTRASNFSDGDSYSLILAYLNFFNEGIYTPSRGAYGHPIPELLIGFFAYHFGTPFSNIFCFSMFFFSLIFFYKTFCQSEKNIALFFLLILSNFYLFFENTNSIDYPIAIFFFSLGLYFLKKEKFFYAYIILGFTIASRANFLTFVYPILLIYFYDEIKNKKIKNILISFMMVTLVGLFFYIPLFHLHNYTLGFLDLPFLIESDKRIGWYGGPELSLKSLFPRFGYKVYLIMGIYSSILFIFFSSSVFNKIKILNKDNIILIFVIFVNLFVFFFMPTKILIINPFIIFLYIIFFKYLDTKKVILLIFLNFLPWVVTYQIADITYKEKDICFAKEALSYDFNISIHKGKFVDYLFNEVDMSKCYSQFMGVYSTNFKEGKPLKLSK